MIDAWVVIRGGGDLGSGVALRLWRAGFGIVVLETARPMAVRRTVSLSEAVYAGSSRVEELRGYLAESANGAAAIIGRGGAAVLVDPRASLLARLAPSIVVDAILAKRNLGTSRAMAQVVIGLGPGFHAGVDVHAVVETNRGPNLGRVYWSGGAEPDTGKPGDVQGMTSRRVLRAPRDGTLRSLKRIGDFLHESEPVAQVDGVEVRAPFGGLLRGLVRDGLRVTRGMKIGDVDPRMNGELVRLVSDKSLAVAGGVLEAVLAGLRHNR